MGILPHRKVLFPIETVLVVDQEPDARDLYSFMLADVARHIEFAEDGRNALAKALAHPPNLIVTDARIPFIDGYALCRTLRHNPATMRIPIILATAQSGAVSMAGVDAVLVKPFSTAVFITTIRMILADGRVECAETDAGSSEGRGSGNAA